MPAKKIMTVEIAAMRSEFHKGYQSIEHLPFAASGGRFAKGTILSVRMAPFVSPKKRKGLLHRRGITIPAPFQARQSCRFLENGLLFPSQTALHRFPLRAKCFLPEGELPRSGQEKPLWRAHMSRQKTDLN